MYWRQIVAAAVAGVVVAYALLDRGMALGTAAAAAVAVYIVLRWVFATVGRTKYWRQRRGPRRTCAGCGARIRRQPGDWIRTCYHCGEQAGWPGSRWLTHSVLTHQLKRTVSTVPLIVLLILSGTLVTGVPQSITHADLPSGALVTLPDDGDPDGDLIPNSSEGTGVYSASDPLRKDLYVRVVIGSDVDRLPSGWKSMLIDIFESMPVGNPSGEEGIKLHIVSVSETNKPVDADAQMFAVSSAFETVPESDSELPCKHLHTVAIGELEYLRSVGFGSAPGVGVIVDATPPEGPGDAQYLAHTITHELLHNIVGKRLNPDHDLVTTSSHTMSGWLSKSGTGGAYLSSPVQQLLTTEGYAPLDDLLLNCGNASIQ